MNLTVHVYTCAQSTSSLIEMLQLIIIMINKKLFIIGGILVELVT